jgi:TRAP-type mannitol/chloroaromatic compound transport system permease large subunit
VRIRKELWFGFILMAAILVPTFLFLPAPWNMGAGHLGLLMLCLVVVAIMLGFPTAFTLMGMGVIFAFLAYRFQAPAPEAMRQTLMLMVQRTYAVMTNDVLISVPLFVFMGYLVERAALIEKLFKSLHLAIGRLPGSLAVATLVTCAVFATATGIIGAVVTLMGLLALPAMIRARYDVKLSAGVITAGGCLGILIPPSVLLILYGATASVSVVQLYAGAFFPGLMLAGLYIGYVVLRAWINPKLAPRPPPEEQVVQLPEWATRLPGGRKRLAIPAMLSALRSGDTGIPRGKLIGQLGVATLPALMVLVPILFLFQAATTVEVIDTGGLEEIGEYVQEDTDDTLSVPESAQLQEPPGAGLQEPPGAALEEPPGAAAAPAGAVPAAPAPVDAASAAPAAAEEPPVTSVPAPAWFWIVVAVGVAFLILNYAIFTVDRFQVFKMLLGSFFPLSALILSVLGSIIFGWATPTEAAAMGATGGMVLAAAYRKLTLSVVKESVFLTAKTTAMVCWLFVGSSIFSAAFALLGGQEIVETWVLSLNMTPVQFMLLAQFIIFVLGWPLEWTEIIVIFMPIFLPLLGHFNVDPLFFGLLVALNLQTAFLSPPVAMAAFYLKGVAPPHVTLNQIFAGMMPFMAIQVLALALLYMFPDIGLWLPRVLYGN